LSRRHGSSSMGVGSVQVCRLSQRVAQGYVKRRRRASGSGYKIEFCINHPLSHCDRHIYK